MAEEGREVEVGQEEVVDRAFLFFVSDVGLQERVCSFNLEVTCSISGCVPREGAEMGLWEMEMSKVEDGGDKLGEWVEFQCH